MVTGTKVPVTCPGDLWETEKMVNAARFREIPHTADLGYEIEAADLPTLFRQAAGALVDALGARPAATVARTEGLHLRRPDLERLLVAWLRELLHGALAGRAAPHVQEIDVQPPERGVGARLDARLEWRPWTAEPVREIKGVTYHGLAIESGETGWHATVVFDV